jgi:murein L,D-transpeptidase YafK
MRMMTHTLLILSFLMFGCIQPTTEITPMKPRTALKEVLTYQNITAKDLLIDIDKKGLTLSVMHGDSTIRTYPVVLGGNQVDDKRMQGDQCTPEGQFGIRNMYPHKSWSFFIWVDYPNEDSWLKHNASKEAGDIPQTASIGGEIGIHGVPEDGDFLIDDQNHWTLGCIALKTADITDLYEAISTETKVFIH